MSVMTVVSVMTNECSDCNEGSDLGDVMIVVISVTVVSVTHIIIFGYRLYPQGFIFQFSEGVRYFSVLCEGSRQVLGYNQLSSMLRCRVSLYLAARRAGRKPEHSFPFGLYRHMKGSHVSDASIFSVE